MKPRTMLVSGMELVSYSVQPARLRRFLEHNPGRIGAEAPRLKKSILVFSSDDGSPTYVTSHLSFVNSSAVEKGHGAEDRPMIERTGKYPPSMRVAVLDDNRPDTVVTTDPNEQRIGCSYISLQSAVQHVAKLLYITLSVCKAYEGSASCDALDWERKLEEAYDKVARVSKVDERKAIVSGLDDAIRKAMQPSEWEKLPQLLDPQNHDSQKHRQLVQLLCPLEIGRLQESQFDKLLSSAWEQCLARPPKSNYLHVSETSVQRAFITLLSARTVSIHLVDHQEQIAKQLVPDDVASHEHDDIVIQGAGDLSMNFWNVAVLGGDQPTIVKVSEEPLDKREYSCLIAFDSDGFLEQLPKKHANTSDFISAGALAIGRLKLNRYAQNDHRASLITERNLVALGKQLRYALYGKRVVWNGKVIRKRELVAECSDIRHVFDMPNLNLAWPADEAKANIREAERQLGTKFPASLAAAYSHQPRYLFGVAAIHDVWLGEYVLLNNLDMRRLACDYPVEMQLSDLGAPREWITVCLIAWGYKLRESRRGVEQEGDFYWDASDPTDPKLVWFLKSAKYPCTMVGIGKLGRPQSVSDDLQQNVRRDGDLFMLAWGHEFKQDQSYSIEECAEILSDLGAQAVLLIDEGQDVFQYHFSNLNDMRQHNEGENHPAWCPVPVLREQIRASISFWMACRKTSESDGKGGGI